MTTLIACSYWIESPRTSAIVYVHVNIRAYCDCETMFEIIINIHCTFVIPVFSVAYVHILYIGPKLPLIHIFEYVELKRFNLETTCILPSLP